MQKERQPKPEAPDESLINHVGGVNDSLGGVDPEIDATLIRLSGGP